MQQPYASCDTRAVSSEVFWVGIPGHHFGTRSKLPSSLLGLLLVPFHRAPLGAQFIKVGSSLGPLPPELWTIERLKARLYRLYGVRDTLSISQSKSASMLYFPDLAFLSHDIEAAAERVLTRRRNQEAARDPEYHFVSFRGNIDPLTSSDAMTRKLLNVLAKYFAQYRQAHVVIGFQVPADRETCKVIEARLRSMPNLDVEFIDRTLELHEALDVVVGATSVLSNRLHVLLPALIGGVTPFALVDVERHSKISALFRDIGAADFLFDVASEVSLPRPHENCERLRSIVGEQRQVAETVLAKSLGLEGSE